MCVLFGLQVAFECLEKGLKCEKLDIIVGRDIRSVGRAARTEILHIDSAQLRMLSELLRVD